MPRQQLQAYLDRVYPNSRLDSTHTLGGKVHIRFGLGDGQPNGSAARVQQATERAITVFSEAFPDPQSEMFVLIYDWHGQTLWGAASQEYLSQQFPAGRYSEFHKETVLMHTGSGISDARGNFTEDRVPADILIGLLPIGEINVPNILRGLIGLEMGQVPAMPQQVYFFHPSTDRSFHLYDDRGCYLWSDQASKLREIYDRRKDWIPEYHRAEIAGYFGG
jgi:hypothetical protein